MIRTRSEHHAELVVSRLSINFSLPEMAIIEFPTKSDSNKTFTALKLSTGKAFSNYSQFSGKKFSSKSKF